MDYDKELASSKVVSEWEKNHISAITEDSYEVSSQVNLVKIIDSFEYIKKNLKKEDTIFADLVTDIQKLMQNKNILNEAYAHQLVEKFQGALLSVEVFNSEKDKIACLAKLNLIKDIFSAYVVESKKAQDVYFGYLEKGFNSIWDSNLSNFVDYLPAILHEAKVLQNHINIYVQKNETKDITSDFNLNSSSAKNFTYVTLQDSSVMNLSSKPLVQIGRIYPMSKGLKNIELVHEAYKMVDTLKDFLLEKNINTSQIFVNATTKFIQNIQNSLAFSTEVMPWFLRFMYTMFLVSNQFGVKNFALENFIDSKNVLNNFILDRTEKNAFEILQAKIINSKLSLGDKNLLSQFSKELQNVKILSDIDEVFENLKSNISNFENNKEFMDFLQAILIITQSSKKINQLNLLNSFNKNFLEKSVFSDKAWLMASQLLADKFRDSLLGEEFVQGYLKNKENSIIDVQNLNLSKEVKSRMFLNNSFNLEAQNIESSNLLEEYEDYNDFESKELNSMQANMNIPRKDLFYQNYYDQSMNIATDIMDTSMSTEQVLLLESLGVRSRLGQKQNLISSLCWKKDMLATGYNDASIKLWNESDHGFDWFGNMQGHTLPIYDIKIYKNFIISASADNTVAIWDNVSKKYLYSFRGHKESVNSVDVGYHLTNMGETEVLVSGSDDGTVKLWSFRSAYCMKTLDVYSGVTAVVLLQDLLITGSKDQIVRIWDLAQGECLHRLVGHQGTITDLKVVGKKIFSSSRDQTIRIWSLEDGRCLKILGGHNGAVNCLAVNDEYIVSGGEDKTVRVWRMTGFRSLRILKEHNDSIIALGINGSRLISAGADQVMFLWNIDTGNIEAKMNASSRIKNIYKDD